MASHKSKTTTTADGELADSLRPVMERTHSPRVIDARDVGARGLGLFRLDYDEALFQRNYKEPVLVARAGGVGAKLAIARAAGRWDTIGADLVAAYVNELICVGAEPLFFLPCLHGGELGPGPLAEIVKSIAEACTRAGCSLLDGDFATASPATPALSGFAVGVVERRRVLDGRHTRPGDVVIGLSSDGLHSQGLELARPVLDADELLRPTRLYAPGVLDVLGAYRVKRVVKAMAHIADGGLGGPWPAVLPEGLAVRLRRGSWDIPPIFQLLADRGGLDNIEMMNTFNMGVGFVMIVAPNFAKPVMARLRHHGERCGIIGKVVKGDGLEWA